MDTKQHEVHERLEFGLALAAMAGGLDAYTYLTHGEVFAGLQTGNFILLGIHLGQGNWDVLINYIIPIIAFFLGALIARHLQNKIVKNQPLWFLFFETILLLFVGLLSPFFPDLLVNALLSITAAMQLQAFTKLKGKPFTSLMMTGNLRNLSTHFFDGYIDKDPAKKTAFKDTLFILSSFAFGALVNGFFITYFGEHAILFSLIFLGIAIFLIIKDKKAFL
ncbi:YoaK family protein [Otariodibacter sp.]|uniref:YoaK family protein n=1 Tax=Otariodibacter sp. TaxID=3030919 RepID=UPI00260844D9|nr:YoaK family protein [Otariodibacter sp.]